MTASFSTHGLPGLLAVTGALFVLAGCGPSKEEIRLQTTLEFEHLALKEAKQKVLKLETELDELRDARHKSVLQESALKQQIAELTRENRDLATKLAEARAAAVQTPAPVVQTVTPAPTETPESESAAARNVRQMIAWKASTIPEIAAAAFDARIKVIQAMASGAIASGETAEEVLRTEKVKSKYQNPLESGTRYETVVRSETEMQPLPDYIYVHGLIDVADNETRDVRLFPAGFHTRTMADGSVKRLKRYALDPETAADLIVTY